jgi:hypothetical protein
MQPGQIIVVFSWRWGFYDLRADRFFRSFRATRFYNRYPGFRQGSPYTKDNFDFLRVISFHRSRYKV